MREIRASGRRGESGDRSSLATAFLNGFWCVEAGRTGNLPGIAGLGVQYTYKLLYVMRHVHHLPISQHHSYDRSVSTVHQLCASFLRRVPIRATANLLVP